MNSAHLLRTLGDVDPVFVDITPIEDLMREKKRTIWIKGISIAACFALIVGCLCYAYPQQRIVYPDENTPYLYSADANTVPFSTYFGVEKSYTYSELAALSDIIVVANVVDVEEGKQRVFRGNMVSVSIRDILKGDMLKGDVLRVREPTTGMYSHNPSVPMMQKGNRVLLFLKKNEGTQTYYCFIREYPSIGIFYYDRDGKYHEAATYGNAFPTEIHEMLFEDYEPKTLEEIKELIISK